MQSKNGLIRALSLGALITYGVGDILGAGVYALIGKIAGHAGPLAWLSFTIAMSVVFLTALSYSELCSRFPKSGGVSIFIQEAFGQEWLSILVGFLLFSATILSMSTLSQAFIGYLRALGFMMPNWLGIAGFLSILLLINVRGIKQSSITNIISTAVEVSGLLMVLAFGCLYLLKTNNQPIVTPPESMPGVGDVLHGAALAFFAFIGFEDLANVAEEVKKPEKNLPRGILYSLGIAGLLYLGVSWVSTAIVPMSELNQSNSPLLEVVSKSYPEMPISLFSVIAIFAVSNSTLVNYITASRLLYGMSKVNLLPKFLQTIHRGYHTPYVAILLIFPLVLGLASFGSLKGLAGSTSAVILTVFSFSSVALIKVKLKERNRKTSAQLFRVPMLVPWLAVILNITAIGFLPFYSIILAAVFIAVGLMIIAFFRMTIRRGEGYS
ncbi:APC family permease [Legionella brunensis]|uniref:Amino acid transporter n=1 Tax=Legionella brunensis TaxID=29422 RepID=A0A0W0ST98_9GAMM|nr:APC family permease [Legionella brunensis]KTC86574.1 amino acid transporter [Legionella brunensis]